MVGNHFLITPVGFCNLAVKISREFNCMVFAGQERSPLLAGDGLAWWNCLLRSQCLAFILEDFAQFVAGSSQVVRRA